MEENKLPKEVSTLVGTLNLLFILMEVTFIFVAFIYLCFFGEVEKAVGFSVLACSIKYLLKINRSY